MIALFAINSFSQAGSASKLPVPEKAVVAAVTNAPLDLAKATLAAHGGDKLKNMRSIVMKGPVDLNAFNQAMPGAFSMAISGEKY